jgi:hypothetical protein
VRWVVVVEGVEDVAISAVEGAEGGEADEVADEAVDVEVEDVVGGIETCSMSLMAIRVSGQRKRRLKFAIRVVYNKCRSIRNRFCF